MPRRRGDRYRRVGRAGEQTTLRWIRLPDQRRLAEVEDATPIDLGAPIRITGPAQRMMEDVAGMPRPFSGE